MLSFTFASILLPVFTRMQKRDENFQPLLLQSFKAISFLAISAIVLSFTFRHQVMELLYHDYTPYWGNIFGVLVISFYGVASMYIYGSLLTGGGYLKHLNFIGIGGVVLNVVLNVVLIRRFEAMGATVATVITQTLVAAAHILVARHVFGLRLKAMIAPVIPVFLLISIALCYIIVQFDLHWLLQVAIIGGGLIAAGIGLRMIDILSELRHRKQPNK
jgi:O-antigen/teichoic acid export membrane protein